MYEKKIRLNDNEFAAKINAETGEITELNKINNSGLVDHQPRARFKKYYEEAWKLLKSKATDQELLIAYKLAERTTTHTNEVVPLNDKTTNKILSEELGVSRNRVKCVIGRLFDLGVLGKFETVETIEFIKVKYWIFNPYLVFNGRRINKSLLDLFKNSPYKD